MKNSVSDVVCNLWILTRVALYRLTCGCWTNEALTPGLLCLRGILGQNLI